MVERLIVELELAGLQGAAQVKLQRATRLKLLVHGRLEEVEGSSPVGLGAIKGHVGLLEQLVGVVAVGRRDGHPDTGADHHMMPVQVERRGHGLHHPLGQARGSAQVGQARLDHRELVAAQPRHRVAIADAAAQAFGGDAQQLIADRMAQGVVHALEAVEIDEVHGQLVAFAPPP